MEKHFKIRYQRILFLLFGMLLWLFCLHPVHAAQYRAIAQGKTITAYPLKTGTIRVYEDSGRLAVIDRVSGKNLSVKISKVSEGSLYGRYKKGTETCYGWFSEKDFVANPSYSSKTAMARYKGSVYKRKGGSSFGSVPDYADMEVIGKSGNWYQIIYQYDSAYRMGWMKKSVYDIIIRYYDGTEKHILAEGNYRITPKNKSSFALTEKNGILIYEKKGKSLSQQFAFQFTEKNCYKLVQLSSGRCLSAAEEDGIYLNQVVLTENDEETTLGQIWQLIRSGGYYYLKNKGTNLYLNAGTTLTLGKKSTSSRELFQIVRMNGKNQNDWQVFSQYDPKWGGKKYGKTNTMAGAACGILSLTNAVYALNGQFIDPMKLASYAVKAKYRIENNGTVYTFFKAAAKKYGKDYGFAYRGSTMNLTVLKNHLKAGGTAIAYVPGHYLAVADYKSGKYLILDSYAQSKRKTSPYGNWVTGSRFRSGGLKAKAFFLLKAR